MKRFTIRLREYQDYDLCVEATSEAIAIQFAEEMREADGLESWDAHDPDETDMEIICTEDVAGVTS